MIKLAVLTGLVVSSYAFAGNISERREASKSPTLLCVVSVPVKKVDSGKDAPIVCRAQTAPAAKPEQARPGKQ